MYVYILLENVFMFLLLFVWIKTIILYTYLHNTSIMLTIVSFSRMSHDVEYIILWLRYATFSRSFRSFEKGKIIETEFLCFYWKTMIKNITIFKIDKKSQDITQAYSISLDKFTWRTIIFIKFNQLVLKKDTDNSC